MEFFPLS